MTCCMQPAINECSWLIFTMAVWPRCHNSICDMHVMWHLARICWPNIILVQSFDFATFSTSFFQLHDLSHVPMGPMPAKCSDLQDAHLAKPSGSVLLCFLRIGLLTDTAPADFSGLNLCLQCIRCEMSWQLCAGMCRCTAEEGPQQGCPQDRVRARGPQVGDREPQWCA